MEVTEQKAFMLGFDNVDPPSYDRILGCIHCGLCLPKCPTYRELGVEADSPRGRVYLIKSVADGNIPINEKFIEHMYLCLDCRACETACPSGVHFGEIMEAARGQIERNWKRPLPVRLIREIVFKGIFPYPKRLRFFAALLRFYQQSGLQSFVHRLGILKIIPGNLEEMQQMLPPLPTPGGVVEEVTPAKGEKKYRVGFISGCVMDFLFPSINQATLKVLTENGCEVVTPKYQNCCGALNLHAGVRDVAKKMARNNIDAFERAQVDYIIINAAGCGSTLKEYGILLEQDPKYAEKAREFSRKTRDISEFLVEISFKKPNKEIRKRVAYDDPCHLMHGQKITKQPRMILNSIPGLELVEIKDADFCCGSAGIYNVTHREMSMKLLERKMSNILASGADMIATGNPGCILQIRLGVQKHQMSAEVLHPVELLAQAYD
ncbi:MAG: 4Fe-4S dicluster domain-containing protein [Nitrospira sp.]|nr:4Fe-4S dicluster domain-containing protein [Nitrospira sp.]